MSRHLAKRAADALATQQGLLASNEVRVRAPGLNGEEIFTIDYADPQRDVLKVTVGKDKQEEHLFPTVLLAAVRIRPLPVFDSADVE